MVCSSLNFPFAIQFILIGSKRLHYRNNLLFLFTNDFKTCQIFRPKKEHIPNLFKVVSLLNSHTCKVGGIIIPIYKSQASIFVAENKV